MRERGGCEKVNEGECKLGRGNERMGRGPSGRERGTKRKTEQLPGLPPAKRRPRRAASAE